MAFPSVASRLLLAGVGGVVAMTYSIYVDAATQFMKELYGGLIQGHDLARAVALGRQSLMTEQARRSPIGPTPLQDWLVPTVFEAAPVRVVDAPLTDVRLTLTDVTGSQERPQGEIDCPRPPDYGFIGRDGVIQELERAFRQQTIVLLEGMAGIGKTETAVGFGRWLAETGGLDGPIFFFSFEHHLPLAQVVDRVGTVLQQFVKQQTGQEWHLLDADRRRDLAVQLLRSIPCLLIWDNVEPVHGFPAGAPSAWTDAEQQELKAFLIALQGGQTHVLLTSRRDEPWLGRIHRRLPLPGLPLHEAQELAVKVLERAGFDAAGLRKVPAYVDLMKYLDGNPLAIQVILPELARGTNPDALLASLRTGEAKLSGR